MSRVENPFHITKSNDLLDEQIDELWVSAGDKDSDITSLVRPTSPMAMFILGGKGSGKSHLMRHYSFAVQLIRFQKNQSAILEGIRSDGYVGIYARFGGLNSHRFTRKRQSEATWADLFAYYLELWVADKTLEALEAVISTSQITLEVRSAIAAEIAGLFDAGEVPAASIFEVRQYLGELRRSLDFAINNSSLNKTLDVEILVTRGKLFFGIPAIACRLIPQLSSVRFVYLLDEFENLTTEQQIYLNTLIREKDGPMSFKIGSRLYGFKTLETLSGGERNREGAEFEALRLDERFRSDAKQYGEFANKIIARRLSSALGNNVFEKEHERLDDYFEQAPDLSTNSQFLLDLVEKVSAGRSHIVELRENLEKAVLDGLVIGPKTASDVELIIDCVTFPESPLLEKLLILQIYQQWFRSADLVFVAREARAFAESYLGGARGDKFAEFVNKHRADMVAQLLRENSKRQIYAGIKTFIRMSEGLPRALITTLKHVFDWSIYLQEKPFSGGRISLRAQERGVSEAADWFLDHMLEEGDAGLLVKSGVDRLSRLFRVNRFANKPIETSMIAFSTDEVQLDARARKTIKSALDTSILINVSRGQRERNSELISQKLELNTMLSPRFDLPTARRGVASLSVEQSNAIFVYEFREQFEMMLKEWESKMTAPYFGRTVSQQIKDPNQPDLFG